MSAVDAQISSCARGDSVPGPLPQNHHVILGSSFLTHVLLIHNDIGISLLGSWCKSPRGIMHDASTLIQHPFSVENPCAAASGQSLSHAQRGPAALPSIPWPRQTINRNRVFLSKLCCLEVSNLLAAAWIGSGLPLTALSACSTTAHYAVCIPSGCA